MYYSTPRTFNVFNIDSAIRERVDVLPGWAIFPTMGKRPVIDHWPEEASADLDGRAELAKHHHDGWAVAAGPSGLFIVDLDMKDDANGMAEWASRVGQLKSPVWGRTPSGGAHLYWDDPGERFGPRVGLWPSVDIRSARSYVVFAGPGRTLTAEAWAFPPVPAEVLEAYPRPAPERPRSRVLRTKASGDRKLRALEAACDRLATTGEGRRNALLNWAAFKVGRPAIAAGVSPRLVHHMLLAAALDSGLGDEEAERTITSGLKGLDQ